LTLILGLASMCMAETNDVNVNKVPYGWSSGDVKANGITIHYYRTGNGTKPAMVMSHGYTDNGLNWTDLAHELSPNYDVIMYDLRGHGLSDAPQTGYGIKDYTGDIVGLIKELKLEHPILIGHSLGGCIVASVAANYPDIPKKVIMIDPPGLGRPWQATAEDINKAKQWFANDINYQKGLSREELLKEVQKRHPTISKAAKERWADSKMQVREHPQVAQSVWAIAALPDDLPKVKLPALILKADANNAIRKIETEAVSKQPNIKLYHVKGAGHLVHMEKPEESLKVINEFLEDSGKK